MELQKDNLLFGVHRGCYVGNFDRVDDINNRIQSRQTPDTTLQQNIGMRAVPTRYTLFPVANHRKPTTEPLVTFPRHRVETNFNPAQLPGPIDTYLANIDIETVLRNRTFALQRGEQPVYVPHSNSDLYGYQAVGRSEPNVHPHLSERHTYSTTQPEVVAKLGKSMFFNNTRVQLKDL